MRTIWKFPLGRKPKQTIEVSGYAQALYVCTIDDDIYVWIEHEPLAEALHFFHLHLVDTGAVLPEDADEYIGTVVIPKVYGPDPYVAHVYTDRHNRNFSPMLKR